MRSIIFVVCLLFASSFGLNAQESGGTQTNEVAQAPATQNPPASPDTGQGLEPQNSATSATRPSDREIADKVNNPVAPVTIIEFRNILVPNVAGADGITDTLEMQPIFTIKPRTLVAYADLCGWALARAHAKAGDPAMIAGYLGAADTFDKALVQYSKAYADQAERDYEVFQAAIRSGRLSTEPEKSSGLEFLL